MAAELRDLAADGGRARVDADPVARHGRRRPRPRSRNTRISSPRAAGTRCRPARQLRIGSKGPRGRRLCATGSSRRATSIRSPARGRSTIPSSRRRSSASRPATASARPASVDEDAFTELNVPAAGAPAAARDQHRPAADLFGRSRPALRDRQHSRPPRSRRSRTASSIRITPPASARSTASRRSCRPTRPRSISTRSGPCRLR